MAVTPVKYVVQLIDKSTGLVRSNVNVKITKDSGSTFLPSSSGIDTDSNGIAVINVSSIGNYDVYVAGSLNTDYQAQPIIPLDTNQILGSDISGASFDLSETDGDFGQKSLNAHGAGGDSTNVCIGRGTVGTSAVNNTMVGEIAGSNNTTGAWNTCIGALSLYGNTEGLKNTAVGRASLINNTTGDENTALGNDSLRYLQSGSDNIALDNCTGVGNDTRVSGSNQVQIGDSSTTTYVYGTVQNRSDARDKDEINDSDLGLGFIEKLRPVSYKWDMREDYFVKAKKSVNGKKVEYLKPIPKDGSKKRGRKHYGFVAQEIKQLLDDEKIDFGGFQDHSMSKGGCDVMSLGYDEFIAPLIKAVQELSEKVKKLEGK